MTKKELEVLSVINNLKKNVSRVHYQIERIEVQPDVFLPESDRLMVQALREEIELINFEIGIFKIGLKKKPVKKTKKKVKGSKWNT